MKPSKKTLDTAPGTGESLSQGKVASGPASAPAPAVFLEDVYDSSKVLTRGRHLELLTFELLRVVETSLSADALESADYEACRTLYKALAHGRRPDGSSY